MSSSISWETAHEDALLLGRKIHEKGIRFDQILAIPRGGLFPALILSQVTGCQNVTTWPEWPDRMEDLDKLAVLVVDDIVDTGKMLVAAKRSLPKSHFVALYTKIEHPLLYTYGRKVGPERLDFPWESAQQISKK